MAIYPDGISVVFELEWQALCREGGIVEAATAFKIADATSYDEFAADFELFTERFTRPLAVKVIDSAGFESTHAVLDVGCGTGVLTRLAARRVAGSGHVTGVDLSSGMLRTAEQRAATDGISEYVTLQAADAEQLPFADRSFDSVMSLFALRHFPNPSTAVSEMFRVLRPGGQCTIGVGSGAPWRSAQFVAIGWRTLREYLASLNGRAPLLATGTLDDLLDEHLGRESAEEMASWTHGVEHFARPVSALMAAAGFASIQSRWVGQTSIIESIDEFWRVQLVFSSRARKRVPAAPPEAQARLRAAFDARCRDALAHGAKMLYRSGTSITSGIRSS